MDTLRGARPQTLPGQPSQSVSVPSHDALVAHWVHQIIHPAVAGRDDAAAQSLLAHLARLGRTPAILRMHRALRALGPLYDANIGLQTDTQIQIAKVALLAAQAAVSHDPDTHSDDPLLRQAKEALVRDAHSLIERCPAEPPSSPRSSGPMSLDAWQPERAEHQPSNEHAVVAAMLAPPERPQPHGRASGTATLEAPTLPNDAWGAGGPLVRIAARAEATPAEFAALYGPHKSRYIEDYSALGFRPGARFSHLHGHEGERLGTMTETLAVGSFGKMRLFFSNQGFRCAVKELRLQAKPGMNNRFVGHTKTHATSLEAAMGELKITEKIRGDIDRERLALQDSRPGELDVHHLHGASEPFRVYGSIKDTSRKKLYILMTLAAGDLAMLAANLHPIVRPAAAFSLAAQGYMELTILHRSRGHFDIKPDNIFLNAAGKFELMDLGMVQDVDPRGRTFEQYRRIGSLAVPEFRDGHGKLLTTAVDIYAMAISIFELADGSRCGRAFYLKQYSLPQGRVNSDALTDLFERLETYKQAHLDPETGLVSAKLIRPTGEFGRLFYALAVSRPSLCELLINRAMTLDPKQRWSASELLEAVRGMIPEQDPGMHDRMLKTAESTQDNENMPTFEEVQRYNAWHDAEAEKTAAQVQAARGLPRPLP